MSSLFTVYNVGRSIELWGCPRRYAPMIIDAEKDIVGFYIDALFDIQVAPIVAVCAVSFMQARKHSRFDRFPLALRAARKDPILRDAWITAAMLSTSMGDLRRIVQGSWQEYSK